jgi:hypothetical protein
MKRIGFLFLLVSLVGLACTRSVDIASTPVAISTSTPIAKVNLPAGSTETAMLPAATSCSVLGNLHLRSQPNADAPVVGWLRNGDVVASIPQGDGVAVSGDWRAVQTKDGVSGYAHGAWLDCGGE